jgi:hypothetical protein
MYVLPKNEGEYYLILLTVHMCKYRVDPMASSI